MNEDEEYVLMSNIEEKKNVNKVDIKDYEEFSRNALDYKLYKRIGTGASASVYYAEYGEDMKPVAVKIIELDIFERDQINHLKDEISYMARCRHPHVLPIYVSFVYKSQLWIVMPYMDVGSCLEIVKRADPLELTENIITRILYQALLGLNYFHNDKYIHRDIKAGNILMNNKGFVMLGDFGVSASLEDELRGGKRTTCVGTPYWMAPEVIDTSKGYNEKADIWSFGITCLELALRHVPYANYPPMKVISMTLNGNIPQFDRHQEHCTFSKNFKRMIKLCLQIDPNKRPSAEQLLQHPFFADTKKDYYIPISFIKHLPPLNYSIQDLPKNVLDENKILDVDSWHFD